IDPAPEARSVPAKDLPVFVELPISRDVVRNVVRGVVPRQVPEEFSQCAEDPAAALTTTQARTRVRELKGDASKLPVRSFRRCNRLTTLEHRPDGGLKQVVKRVFD